MDNWDGNERRRSVNGEYSEIMKRLGDIEIQAAKIEQIVTSSHKAFRESEQRLSELLEKHNHIIHGNGKEGLITRIGLLEQTEKNRAWNIRILWTATIGGIINAVFDLVKWR